MLVSRSCYLSIGVDYPLEFHFVSIVHPVSVVSLNSSNSLNTIGENTTPDVDRERMIVSRGPGIRIRVLRLDLRDCGPWLRNREDCNDVRNSAVGVMRIQYLYLYPRSARKLASLGMNDQWRQTSGKIWSQLVIFLYLLLIRNDIYIYIYTSHSCSFMSFRTGSSRCAFFAYNPFCFAYNRYIWTRSPISYPHNAV